MTDRSTDSMLRSKTLLPLPVSAGAEGPTLCWGDRKCSEKSVVLLHGLPQKPDVFMPIADGIATPGMLLIAPYLYGHLHKRPQDPQGEQLQRFIENVLAVADRFELERFDVVGSGIGAAVGWMLAARCPGRVRFLACIHFPHPVAAAATSQWDQGDVPLDVRQDNREPLTDASMTAPAFKQRHSALRQLLLEQGLPRKQLDVYASRLSAPGVLELALEWNAPQPPQALPPLDLPVLLVSNAGSRPSRPDNLRQLVASGRVQQAVLKGTHFPLEHRSPELAAVLEKHLLRH